MHRPALLLLVVTGCSFDATGFGAPPVTSNATAASSGPGTATGESSGGVEPTSATGETGAGPGTGSLSGSSGSGEVTTEPGTATTGGTTTETSATSGTTVPGTSTEPCETMAAFVDADGDGHGDPNMPTMVCVGEWDGVAGVGDDCNDAEPKANPALSESCDAIDNNCNGIVDEYDSETNKTDCADCHFRFYNARLYYFCNADATWDSSRMFCVARGLDLAIGNDPPEHDFMVGEIDDLSGTGALWWIGGRKSGSYKWVDGSAVPVPDGRWAGGEPNGISYPTVKGECMAIISPGFGVDGKWLDWDCGEGRNLVCEQKG